MSSQTDIANEIHATLRQNTRGVRAVRIDDGLITVYVSSSRAAFGVKMDLLRCGGFQSVESTPDAMGGKGFLVHAVARMHPVCATGGRQ